MDTAVQAIVEQEDDVRARAKHGMLMGPETGPVLQSPVGFIDAFPAGAILQGIA